MDSQLEETNQDKLQRWLKDFAFYKSANYSTKAALSHLDLVFGEDDVTYIFLIWVKERFKIKIVTLCGSTKFKSEFERLNKEETIKGQIVLSVGAFPHSDFGGSPEETLGEDIKIQLDVLHKKKIYISDEIIFISVDGYIGTSTTSEMEYSIKMNKKIRFVEQKLKDIWIKKYPEYQNFL